MDKKLAKLMEPGFKVIFSLLLIFVAVTCYFSVPAAIAEGLLVAVAFLFYKRGLRKRRREIRRYVEALAFQADNASKSTMVNSPFPSSSCVSTRARSCGRTRALKAWWEGLYPMTPTSPR